VWALHTAWPDICNKLWWFDFYHPDTIHPATIAAVNAMLAGEDNDSRKFDCPVFVAESRHGWPRTCNNVKSSNMAELRRHLTARAGRGYAPQLAFLELCPTCNEDFLDRDVFQTRHGYRGEFCNTRRPQRRWPHSRVQWELLYGKVEAAMAVQRLSSRKQALCPYEMPQTDKVIQDQDDLDPPPSRAVSPPGDTALDDRTEEPALEPTGDHRDRTMPYATPYQLIFDSDSDEGYTARSPYYVGSQPNQPYSRLTDIGSRHRPPPRAVQNSQYRTFQCFTDRWVGSLHGPLMNSNLNLGRGGSTSHPIGPVQPRIAVQRWVYQALMRPINPSVRVKGPATLPF
jgi:hypothetical protein